MDTFLSKSDYKIACSCPQKLYFKKNSFPSNQEENEFLKMLAEGGYIVGKLAQLLYPGEEMKERNPEVAAKLTAELLKRDRVTIHEAALIVGQKVVRIDILRKDGDVFDLIEVKSKSFRSTNIEEFKKRDKAGRINSKTRDYIKDVIYQALVLQDAYRQATINAYLLMPDKDSIVSMEGLPSWFTTSVIEPSRSGGFRKVNVTLKTDGLEDVLKVVSRDGMLKLLNVNDEVKEFGAEIAAESSNFIELLNNEFQKYSPVLTKECKKCEYKTPQELQNGFNQCWGEMAGIDPKIWDLYQAGKLANDFVNVKISQGKVDFAQLSEAEFGTGAYDNRRSIQFDNTIKNSEYPSEPADVKIFAAELQRQFQYPLHFVDFETMASAIPFHKGLSPYSMFPFQWSVHTINEPGTQPIHSEFLNTQDGYPGFRFAEKLMATIGSSGTPLMWSSHENTSLRNVLNHMTLLGYSNDRLKNWLTEITREKDKRGKIIRPGRFVDMNDFALKHYFHPDMKGRTSIKVTLPSIWQNFPYLHDIAWFKPWVYMEGGVIVDPYKRLKLDTLPELWGFLPNSIDEDDEDSFEFSEDSYEVKDGGAAMKAYQDMIFSPDKKRREQLSLQLRKYCELDTLAMVIIYTHWDNIARRT